MIKKKFEKDGFTFYEYLGNNIIDSKTNIYTGVPLSEIKKIKTKIEIIEHNDFGKSGYIFITSKASPTAALSPMYVGLKHDKSAGIGIGSTVYNNNIATTTLDVSSSNIAVIGGWHDTQWTTYYRYREIVFYDNNNKIIRDFVPASNGREYGLYDLSNDVFYSNQGNGSFVVSEDFACVVRAVSRICKGVKSECRLELDGSENWILYTTGVGWAGVALADYLPVALRRAAHYSNYFGFTAKNASSRFIWVGVNNKYFFIVWAKGTPPVGYEHWEKDGKADIAAIKVDLAKKHLIIWYDRTDSSVGSMSALIPLIARDTEKVKKVVDVTDQMTNSVGNYYWNAENQEWTGLNNKECCHVGDVAAIITKYGLQRYVMEFDGRSDIEGNFSIYLLPGGENAYSIYNISHTLTTDWQHYELSFVAKLKGNLHKKEAQLSFYGSYGTGKVPHIKNLKIRTAVDVFTRVISEVADGVVEVSPAEVADGVLTIKGDNAKVENNKLIIK